MVVSGVPGSAKGKSASAAASTGATIDLGVAARFAILATTAVTDAGGSMITGDMGTCTGTSLPVYAPYTPGTPGLDGTLHPNDATAVEARAAAIAALNDIKARSHAETSLGGVVELGGLTLGPGLYTSTIAMQSECLCLCSCPSDTTRKVSAFVCAFVPLTPHPPSTFDEAHS